MQFSEIWCPNCDTKIPAVDINIDQLVGKCDRCDCVFSIDQFDRESGLGVGKPGAVADSPSRPSGVTLESEGSEFRLVRRWFHPGLFFLLFFCIGWDGFLVCWYSIAIFGIGGGEGGGFKWMMVVFPLIHVAVGIGLTYYVCCGFLNRTVLAVSSFDLRVWHGPLPWRGNRSLRRDEIREIELEYTGVSENAASHMCVSVHHSDGRQIVLISGLPENQAAYIAWQLANACKVAVVEKRNRDLRQRSPKWLNSVLPSKKFK